MHRSEKLIKIMLTCGNVYVIVLSLLSAVIANISPARVFSAPCVPLIEQGRGNHQIPPSGLYGVVTAFHRGVYAVSTTGLSVSYTRHTASVASECTYVVRL